jgi:hypothetical protein
MGRRRSRTESEVFAAALLQKQQKGGDEPAAVPAPGPQWLQRFT